MYSFSLSLVFCLSRCDKRFPIRRRVNVKFCEKRENVESMTHTKANTYTADATTMGNGNKKFPNHSSSTGDMFKHSAQINQQKDVARWSSNEVQHWIKGQCKKFELKKATAEKFEMNGRRS